MDKKLLEDIEAKGMDDTGGSDNSDVPVVDLTAHVMKRPGHRSQPHYTTEPERTNMGLSSCAEAESDLPELRDILNMDEERRGMKRERKPNKLYEGWWRHADDQDNDLNTEAGMEADLDSLATSALQKPKNKSRKHKQDGKNTPGTHA
ncbi:hypothetical protein E1B28_010640 [Marasmius oreades]|uniref:Uncharacterized protein n=1 Tax=Marasmius oreades TaxID=181124 RepID=A0A9P7USW8_9AGAR|nr:uncharacterized protein E1B28_010640 [Marasmius oreades]KAG7091621.1 hypothetical protein E1B28_010640 [Marasmius oreades]